MATPTAFASVWSQQIISTFDIEKPQNLNTLFRRYGDQGLGFFRIIESMGWKLPVAGELYGHWEEDFIHETFHSLNAESAPGPGNNIDITLEPADLTGAPFNNFYPRLFDSVMFNNEVTGTIIAIDRTTVPTAPVLTIRPNQSTDDIGAIAAGEEIIIISSAFSEGSTQPESVVTGVIRYENTVQIIKETLTTTGSEMTNEKWFDVLSQPGGQNIFAYYLKGQLDADYRMQLKIDGALLFQKSTNNTIVDTDNTAVPNAEIQTTEALIPYIRRVGNRVPYTPGLFTISKFDEATKILDKNFAGNDICSLLGIDIDIEIGNRLVDFFKDTNINYVMSRTSQEYFAGNRELAMSVDFKYLKKGLRTYHFKRMVTFSNPNLYGATGYTQAGLGVMLPMNLKKDKNPRTEMSDIPSFGARYKKLGPYSRMMEVWNVSGAGPSKGYVIADDLHNHYMRCQIGAHFVAGNQMILLDPQ